MPTPIRTMSSEMGRAVDRPDVDVLVAGAGPTGLVLAAVLHAHGVRARVIDQQPGPAHESRALLCTRARWNCSPPWASPTG